MLRARSGGDIGERLRAAIGARISSGDVFFIVFCSISGVEVKLGCQTRGTVVGQYGYF